MNKFDEALASINLKILKYDQSKQRPIATSRGTMNIEKFCTMVLKDMTKYANKYPEIWDALQDPPEMEKVIVEYAEKNKILRGGKMDMEIPPDMEGAVLNMDITATKENRFFLTHPEHETVLKASGEAFILLHQMSPVEAAAQARKVVPEYMPRGERGITVSRRKGITDTLFNLYTPPTWYEHEKWDKLPDCLPNLFVKLVKHLFPLEEEQSYFYAWLYESLFNRAYVFLVLCGIPGSGKNRLKLVLRGLHGHVNSIDGKKSTLVERFNSQLGEATLAWFDELHYDAEMENTMKELQNDSISIERKGIDATRATKIHSSIVISNNKPRDNYIAMDARKFVPLVVTNKRLEESMTYEEIKELTEKVEDETNPNFDPAFLAQIAKWIKRRGHSKRWPNLEYKGPMFWTLAHTSMTRWQKKAVMLLLEPDSKHLRNGYDPEKKAFLWSALQSKANRKNGDKSLQFPDFTSVSAFFESFRDSKGRKAFSTEPVPKNILGDFYVKPLLKELEVLTEASVAEQRGLHNAKKEKEIYDR